MRGFVFLVGLMMTGCAFRGYQRQPPPEALWPAGNEAQTDFSAYLYQPSPKETAALQEGLTEVRSIFGDEEFRGLVRDASDWIVGVETCSGAAPGTVEYAVTGDSVVQNVLSRPFMKVHYLVNRHLGAIATTNMPKHGTAINPWQVEKWSSEDVEVRAEFINTLAHELTHLVPRPHTPGCGANDETDASCTQGHSVSFRYSDDGHSTCTERRLVSYRLGDMAGCYYQLRQAGLQASTPEGRAQFEGCVSEARKLDPPEVARCTSKLEKALQQCQAGSP